MLLALMMRCEVIKISPKYNGQFCEFYLFIFFSVCCMIQPFWEVIIESFVILEEELEELSDFQTFSIFKVEWNSAGIHSLINEKKNRVGQK